MTATDRAIKKLSQAKLSLTRATQKIMGKRTAAEAGFGGEIDLDKAFRSPKLQRLYDIAAQPGNENTVIRDPANIMDNWLTTSRALKEQRASRNEGARKAWEDRKALDIVKTPGEWKYSQDGTRKWMPRFTQTHSNAIEQKTIDLSLSESSSEPFAAKDGDKDISRIYRENWLAGKKIRFIRTIYSEFEKEGRIPEETIWKIFECLVGELVPQDRLWVGAPAHIIAGPNTIWQIGKCIFQILTHGHFWDNQSNVLNPVDDRAEFKKFGEYKQKVLQKRYSRNLMKHVLECFKVNEKNRPTHKALLDHIHLVLSIYDGTYVKKVEDDPSKPYERSDERIPNGLTKAEGAVYETLLNVVSNPVHEIPHIFTITDLARDYDDLLAMMVLKELNRLGLVTLEGFVANLRPAEKRALFGRGALNSLGLDHVTIGVGLPGEADPEKGDLPVMVHEFGAAGQFYPPKNAELGDGQDLIFSAFGYSKHPAKDNDKNTNYTGKKITLLLISSLMDIGTFVEEIEKREKEKKGGNGKNKTDLGQRLAGAVLQGAYRIKDGILTPDYDAVNNKSDPEHTQKFHEFLQKKNIKSTVFTKIATFATYIDTSLFLELASTEHPLGLYLQETQLEQEKAFYERSCSGNPFRPFMTQEWYIENKTGFYAAGHEPDETFPVGDDVLPYLDRITAYDALAAVGAAGEEVLKALKITKPIVKRPDAKHPLHHIYGVLPVKINENEGDPVALPEEANLDGERMAVAICALIKGSILAKQQGLRSAVENGAMELN